MADTSALEGGKGVEVFSLGSEWIGLDDIRLDAGYYNPTAAQAHVSLQRSGLPLKRLGDVTKRIFIPPRFKRVYVDKEHGVPFLQGSHLVHYQPADLKYLSRIAHKKLERWIIEAGWILVTCSGTVGRPAIALRQWHGWAASQHILRIVPDLDGPCPPGYIYAFLSSPIGQAQFNGVYGAVVDELTAKHVANILIPVPETEDQRSVVESINSLALGAINSREAAMEKDTSAVSRVDQLVSLPKNARGRPPKYTMPDPIDASAEEVVDVVLKAKPKKAWRYEKEADR